MKIYHKKWVQQENQSSIKRGKILIAVEMIVEEISQLIKTLNNLRNLKDNKFLDLKSKNSKYNHLLLRILIIIKIIIFKVSKKTLLVMKVTK